MSERRAGSLGPNVVANLAAGGWSLLANIVLVPLYLRVLGAEAYGLVGVLLTLQSLLALFDFGLATALNRELARRRDEAGTALPTLLRTMEVIYAGIAVMLGAGVALAAPWVAAHGLRPETLTVAEVTRAVTLIGVVLAVQWPSTLYAQGLIGLERQVAVAVVQGVFVTARGLGAVAAVFVIGMVDALFACYAVAAALQSLVLGLLLWRALPPSAERPRFDRASLAGVRRFAMGMTGITAVSLVLSNLDKVVLSVTLPLEELGFYTLAVTMAAALSRLYKPAFTAFFPRLARLVAADDEAGVAEAYHGGASLLAVLLLPAAMVLACFSGAALFAWTGDARAVRASRVVVTLLVIGTTLNGLNNLPYALQLAHGWTRLVLVTNTIFVVLLPPLLWWSVGRFGAEGAAAMWLLVNASYVVVLVPLMHRRLLPGHLWRWYSDDVGRPLLATLVVVGGARLWMPTPSTRVGALLVLVLVGAAAQVAAVLVVPAARAWVLRRVGVLAEGG